MNAMSQAARVEHFASGNYLHSSWDFVLCNVRGRLDRGGQNQRRNITEGRLQERRGERHKHSQPAGHHECHHHHPRPHSNAPARNLLPFKMMSRCHDVMRAKRLPFCLSFRLPKDKKSQLKLHTILLQYIQVDIFLDKETRG